ncbi:phage tail protein [Dongia sp.]|uniref:phage tail protein n=1 Tax=Dongia sp. TaxID=1977262 RepID=UPI0035B427F4
MSQDYDIPLVGTFDGAEYAAKIKNTVDAILSSHIGAARPTYAEQGTFWAKYVNSTTIEFYFFDGTSDILVAIFNPTSHALTTLAIPNNGVPLGKIAQINTARLLGRATAGSGDVEALTMAQVAALLPAFGGDSGAGGVQGLVPAPGAGDAAAGYILHADGSWGPPGSGVPAGIVAWTGAASAPLGWIFGYGQEISRSGYAALFAEYGTTHGAGNGTTTFRVPDLRGVTIAGKDDMGGVAAGRLTNPSTTIGGIDGSVLGAIGGAETHSLTANQNGPHTHPAGVATSNGSAGAGPGATNSTTGVSGAGHGHNNVQPTIILNGIIKT